MESIGLARGLADTRREAPHSKLWLYLWSISIVASSTRTRTGLQPAMTPLIATSRAVAFKPSRGKLFAEIRSVGMDRGLQHGICQFPYPSESIS